MKERLTGAIILVALVVLLVPELLTGPGPKQAVNPANAAGNAQLRSYTIDLQDDAANRQPPPSAPAAAAADEPAGQTASPEAEADAPPAATVTPPVDEATRASGRPPMGSGADPSAAAPDSEASAATPDNRSAAATENRPSAVTPESRASAAAPKSGVGAAVTAEDDKPRSAFGPDAAARAQSSEPKPAGKPEAAKSAPATKLAEASKPSSASKSGDASKPPPPPGSKSEPPHVAAAPADSVKASASKGWAVQLGVFASRENADRLAKEVKGSGYPVVINEMSGNGKKLYRVRVGPEADRAAAVALGAKLRAAGHAGSVVPYP